MSFAVIVPTLNASDSWSTWIEAIKSQSQAPSNILIIDSGSHDDTVKLSKLAGFHVEMLPQIEFNHGGTRNRAVRQAKESDIVIFLTQDAILADANALQNILLPFEDENVAAVCGRQLPHRSASAIAAHARLFNYRGVSFVRSYADRKSIGIKTAFLSNSFAAYRMTAFNSVSGFPNDVIFGEDMYVAAKLLKAGYKVAYAADACVYHSHNYSLWQEFKRYFDMGVFHAHEPWIRLEFGGAEGEGLNFVASEMKYLLQNAFWRIPEGMLRTVFRYSGFRLGLIENHLPVRLKRFLAMNKGYFK